MTTQTLSAAQITWAKSHDWFLGDNGDGTILVNDAYTRDGKLYETTVRWADGFKALRNWAGY